MSSLSSKNGNKRETREEILALSVHLFAKHGFDGVSMRDVASAVGLTQAALYYHFPDKEHLYFSTFAHLYRQKESYLKEILDSSLPPWERLEALVTGMSRLIAADRDFMRLMQWILLDSDEARRHKLAVYVFQDMMLAVNDLAGKLSTDHDPHLLASSIFGLVFSHFQNAAISSFFPGYPAQNIHPDQLSWHICDLLRNGLKATESQLPARFAPPGLSQPLS